MRSVAAGPACDTAAASRSVGRTLPNSNSWIGPRRGTANFWDNLANWSSGVPANGSDVAIIASGTYTVVISAADRPYQVRSLTLGSSSGVVRLTDDGSLSVTTNATLTDAIFDAGPGATGSILGNLVLNAGASLMAEGVVNVGGAMSGQGGKVEVDGGDLFAGSLAGSNVCSLSLDGTLEIAGAVSSSTVFSFDDSGANTVLLDDPGATVGAAFDGFSGDNVIDIGSLAYSSSYVVHVSGRSLTIDAGTTPVLTFSNLDNAGSVTLADDGGGGTELVVCYVAGTRIATPAGEVPIENLRENDTVLTANGPAGARPIQWIGHRRIDVARHPRPETVLPVRIRQNAFAAGVPRRDLLVSPEHCIFADGMLIPARRLINGATIVQDRDMRSVEYFHIELERHALLFAEGLPAESYLDTGNRAFYDNAGIAVVLHPEFSINAGLRTWQEDACAPLAMDDAAVEAVWQRLAARAEALGHRLAGPEFDDDPQLCLLAGGRTLRPVCVANGVHTFVLPRGANAVRVVSRSASPAVRRPWLDDRRRLGVAIQRIRFRRADALCEIPMDHPALACGWHDVERQGAALVRWTDGAAGLAVPPDMAGTATMLELHLGGTVPYPAEITARAA